MSAVSSEGKEHQAEGELSGNFETVCTKISPAFRVLSKKRRGISKSSSSSSSASLEKRATEISPKKSKPDSNFTWVNESVGSNLTQAPFLSKQIEFHMESGESTSSSDASNE